MTEFKQLATNTLIQIFGKAVGIAVALIGFGLVARYLAPTGFGYYTMVYAFLTIAGILVDLGLQMTTTKLISEHGADETKILNNALSLRLVGSLVFLALIPLVARLFPYPDFIILGITFAALGFVFSSLSSVLVSFFQKRLIMKLVVAAETIGKIVFLIGIVTVIRYDLGLYGIIFSTVADAIITFTFLLLFANMRLPIRFSYDKTIWKKILLTTWPIALTIALNLIYFKGDIIILSLFKAPSDVGLYGAPYRVLEVIIGIAYLFLGLLLPILSKAASMNNNRFLNIAIQAGFNFLLLLMVPMVVGGVFVGENLMALVAGEAFRASGPLLAILMIATLAIILAGLFGYAVVALNKQKQMIIFYGLNAAISLIAYFIFIPIYSYWAAAWITVGSELFILLTAFWVLHQTTGYRPQLRLAGKIIVSSAIMALFLLTAPSNLALQIVGGAFVYFALLLVLGGVSKKTFNQTFNPRLE